MRETIDRIIGGALAFILGVMVINVLWQVFSRYILANPSSFTDELARYLMIWVGLLGSAYVSGKDMHVAIDTLPNQLKAKNKKNLKKVVYLVVFLFALFALVIGGSRLVYISYLLGQKSPALQIPLALVYSVLPLSGLLIMYYKYDDLKSA